MTFRAAQLWFVIVILAAGYLLYRTSVGLHFQTDLLALLPQDERDPAAERAKSAATRTLSRQVTILIGHTDRASARDAAAAIAKALSESGLIGSGVDTADSDRLRRIGELYFPFRDGLLSRADR
jgi:predicted exporter